MPDPTPIEEDPPEVLLERVRLALADAVDLRSASRYAELRAEAARARDDAQRIRNRSEAVRESRTHARNLIEELQSLVDQLQEALATRAPIEQAKGILMAAQHCSPDEAFDLLRRASQRENRKLRDVACDIVARVSARTDPA